MKERKRLMAERQRQLDSLRVMDAAQLKEATRAQQGTLLAKIKERQSRVHAALAVSAKEELKRLKAEARKAAGMTEDAQSLQDSEDDDDDDEQEGGREAGAAAVVRGSDGSGAAVEGDVQGVVTKEEGAVANAAAKLAAKRAAAKADGAEKAESEASEEKAVEEGQGKDDSDSAGEWEVTATARGSRKQEVDSDSEESFESDSDDDVSIWGKGFVCGFTLS